jgi:osmoprotectant transport system ATP-binding protein
MEALLLADRVVVLDAGEVIGDGAPAELFAGRVDPRVAALMATPLRQAHRVEALAARAAHHG